MKKTFILVLAIIIVVFSILFIYIKMEYYSDSTWDRGTAYLNKLHENNDPDIVEKTVKWFKKRRDVKDAWVSGHTLYVEYKEGGNDFIHLDSRYFMGDMLKELYKENLGY